MRAKRYSSALLWTLRNDVPITRVITVHLDLVHKWSEGYLRFLCPVCSEFNTAANPRTNLARCFRCQHNWNSIDLVMACRACNFMTAVTFLLDVYIKGEGGKNGCCSMGRNSQTEKD